MEPPGGELSLPRARHLTLPESKSGSRSASALGGTSLGCPAGEVVAAISIVATVGAGVVR